MPRSIYFIIGTAEKRKTQALILIKLYKKGKIKHQLKIL
uniref:Uncharacterized protein n=1 Tax=Bartonella rochalimae ATCC BAA-1498 TaxID=685782 RepID=E6YLV1_9HYPH|nr:hypothetical protein BARRO_50202 [Bartonella rochalimae ATCC BAA-1498]